MKGRYLFFNEKLVRTDCFKEQKKSEIVVYEVLRVIDSVPLFYQEHFERLKSSCIKVGKEITIDSDLLYSRINELIKKNKISVGNLMIKIFFYADYYDVSVFFIPHSYPSLDAFQNGVELGFIEAERINPEAKVEQAIIRENANKIINNMGYYEVLLVNKYNQLTEGSRTNLFLIRDNTLITSPLNKVLKGTTLSKVIEIADNLKINIEFQSIEKNELKTVDSMFITGTSNKILPVKKVENYTFDVKQPLLLKIMESYDQLINSYVFKKKGL